MLFHGMAAYVEPRGNHRRRRHLGCGWKLLTSLVRPIGLEPITFGCGGR
jgi:hypothetical protein